MGELRQHRMLNSSSSECTAPAFSMCEEDAVPDKNVWSMYVIFIAMLHIYVPHKRAADTVLYTCAVYE